MNNNLEKSGLIKESALLINKVLKEINGKGPTNYKSYLVEDMFLLKIRGFLNEGQILMARTEQGRDKLKQYSYEMAKVIGPVIRKNLKASLGVEPGKIFFDINPEINEGVILMEFI